MILPSNGNYSRYRVADMCFNGKLLRMDGVPRGITPRLRGDLATAPVVLLEGPRAVGKTWLAHQLVDDGFLRTFVDLTHPSTLERFRDDPVGALSEVVTPAVIDEVQLVPELILAIKAFADTQQARGVFLLTGSARIHSDALGGSDPLVGRLTNLRLRPLTQAEREGEPVNFVETLLNGDLSREVYPRLSRGDLASRIAAGGLPIIPGVLSRASAQARRRAQVAYLDRILAPQFGLPRRDEAGLGRAFRYFAGNPAQVLVVERAASKLGLNRKTIDAYLEDLEARFLIERLPAWRPSASGVARAHPKLHVVDSGLATATAAPEDTDVGSDPQFGGRVESFVVMEILSQAEWSDPGTRAFHWREPSTRHEVDLVLTDSKNEVIAIEIKTSSTVSKHDLRGITAFSEGQALRLGLVFYTGSELRELAPNRWAIPISALWTLPGDSGAGPPVPDSPGAAHRTSSETKAKPPEASVKEDDAPNQPPPEAALFLSYAHEDNEAEHGRITALAEDIATRYELLTGETLPVFTDEMIEWGEQWDLRLGQELTRTTFFVPIITPRFFQRQACRDEVLKFVNKARALNLQEFVMPILYIESRNLEDRSDPVAVAVADSQWVDWGELRYSDRTSGEYRRKIDEMVTRLQTARDTAESEAPTAAGTMEALSTEDGRAEGEDAPDLLESLERFGDLLAKIESEIDELTTSATDLGQQFVAITPELERAGQSTSPRQIRSVLRKTVGPLRAPSKEIARQAGETGEHLVELDQIVSELLVESGDRKTRELLGLDSFLTEILGLASLDFELSEMQGVRNTTRALASFAREMRPIANSIDSVVRVFTDMEAMRTRWVAEAERILGRNAS